MNEGAIKNKNICETSTCYRSFSLSFIKNHYVGSKAEILTKTVSTSEKMWKIFYPFTDVGDFNKTVVRSDKYEKKLTILDSIEKILKVHIWKNGQRLLLNPYETLLLILLGVLHHRFFSNFICKFLFPSPRNKMFSPSVLRTFFWFNSSIFPRLVFPSMTSCSRQFLLRICPM